MITSITFTAYGRPQPQGSTHAFMPKGHTRPIITSDNAKNKPWRQEIAAVALAAIAGRLDFPIRRPAGVEVSIRCYLRAPVRGPRGRDLPTTKPDADKLLRSFLDALTGVVYEDDSQVTTATITKVYGVPERAVIAVSEIETRREPTSPGAMRPPRMWPMG